MIGSQALLTTQRSTLRGGAALVLLLASWGVSAASKPQLCAPEVIGTWKLVGATQPETTLLRFSSDGWANLLSGGSDRQPESFEIIAQVSYSPVPARQPKRLEFQTRRGNDVFPAGKSHWEITAYSDDSLTTQPSDVPAGEQTMWSRVQTQRYYLTLAARNGTPQKRAAAFVMWTTLGPKTELEALGMVGDVSNARLGRIPEELAREFVKHSGRSEDVMMRIELSEAEYHRTHRVLEAWDAVLNRKLLARNDPAAQFEELLDAALQSVNRCAPRLQLPAAKSAVTASSESGVQRIRDIRKLNDKRHVSDKAFPSGWKPAAVGQ